MASQGSNVALVADNQPALNECALSKPEPAPNQVLVKISHVAQNPTDVQSFDSKTFGEGAVYGCDFVGKAVQLGSEVTRVEEGDVIAGEVPGIGAYSHFTLADEKICFKPPSNITPSEAVTVPLAATTAWLALYSKQCLNMNRNNPQSVLIWGGSSSVGQYAIQLAALYSFDVITTCSSKNFELVKKLGAKHVFDYKSEDVIDRIKEVAPDLTFIFDTIGSTTSSGTASKAVTGRGRLCTVRPGKANTENLANNVKVTDVLVWTAFLKDHSYGKFHWPASMDDHLLAAELYEKLPEWLESGKVKPNAVLAMKGLDSVSRGFELHRQGKVSGQKIIYEI
ncbi:hypothetical protein W97_05676 [Coniosporium apollinis CBS 100218]|uniref:Enoyl reductase (ER) domain-containing protein n=1 Tax=Coniosporium apollinis (strain CBS 100218) TaxID=1168221 RepID=R7YWR3_CONA1|nr:uncharacterized protein W97_05676 [Coniosporium apollinis CBS 100218]EON66283.1 hypothetical protein W97_05676 [Coniosporium apollinis CBS 100218]